MYGSRAKPWISVLSAGFVLLLGPALEADDKLQASHRDVAKVERGGVEGGATDVASIDPASIDPSVRASAAAASAVPAGTTSGGTAFVLLAPLPNPHADSQGLPAHEADPNRRPHRRSSTIHLGCVPPPPMDTTALGATDDRPRRAEDAIDALTRSLFGGEPGGIGLGQGLPGGDERDSIPTVVVPVDPRFEAFSRLGSKVFHRQLRRFFRSELRDRYEEDFTYDYLDYINERDQVSRLGRDTDNDSIELLTAKKSVLEKRQDVDEAEDEDLTVVEWGPFRVNDSGHLKIDVKKLGEEPVSPLPLTIAPEEREKPLGESLFKGRICRVNTDLKLRPRFGSLFQNKGARAFMGEIGAAVEVDFFTPILERRYLSTEFAATYDEEGRAGFFVTFKLY